MRRHAARLERAGWLGRAAGIWGQGSVVWLTAQGLVGVGLAGVAAVRAAPAPSPSLTAHGIQVGWSAARIERRGLAWRSARELALERERWGVRARSERGWSTVLPDLAVWLRADAAPVAIVVEAGYRREDRQRMILEGWRATIHAGRYSGVRYDCATESTARLIARLAAKAGLTDAFMAAVAMGPEQIAALNPTPPQPVISPLAETPEAEEAERERRYREIMGYPEPKRRRWRRH